MWHRPASRCPPPTEGGRPPVRPDIEVEEEAAGVEDRTGVEHLVLCPLPPVVRAADPGLPPEPSGPAAAAAATASVGVAGTCSVT